MYLVKQHLTLIHCCVIILAERSTCLQDAWSHTVTTRLLYISTPQFGVPSLRLLAQDSRFELAGVLTQPDKPAGRGLKLTPPPIKVAALELGLKVLQPHNLRTTETQAAIQKLDPDLIAVAAYGLWIPDQVFDLPPKRSLNLHPSLLPRHRGAAPVLSTILAGETKAGLSVLFVEDEMDEGDLLAQMTVPIGPQETTASIMSRLAEVGAPFFADTLAGWAAGEITPQVQDHSQATWVDRLEKKDGLIDWKEPAAKLALRCRAFSPWPGIFTFFDNRRLLIHQVTAITSPDKLPSDAEPGTVLKLDSRIAVICGQGALLLDKVQLESKRCLAIDDFVRGQRNFIGTKLG